MIAYYNSEYPNGIGDIKISSNMEHPFEYMAYEMAEDYYKLLMSKYKELQSMRMNNERGKVIRNDNMIQIIKIIDGIS